MAASQVKRTLQVLGLVLSNASLIKHTHTHTQTPSLGGVRASSHMGLVLPFLLSPVSTVSVQAGMRHSRTVPGLVSDHLFLSATESLFAS